MSENRFLTPFLSLITFTTNPMSLLFLSSNDQKKIQKMTIKKILSISKHKNQHKKIERIVKKKLSKHHF